VEGRGRDVIEVVVVHVDGMRLRLQIVATDGAGVYSPGDTCA
jgi:hypothetical protein